MRIYKIYLLIIISVSSICACNVCDNSKSLKEAELKDIYFNSQNLNNEYKNIIAINAEGNELEEVLNNATLFSPPSINNLIIYLDNTYPNRIFSFNIKKKFSKLLIEENNTLFSSPKISKSGKHIVTFKNNSFIAIYTIENDSIVAKIDELNTFSNHFIDFTISPNSEKLAYISNENNKIHINIYDLIAQSKINSIETDIDFSEDIELNQINIFWSFDSEYIYYLAHKNNINNLYRIKLLNNNQDIYSLNDFDIYEIYLAESDFNNNANEVQKFLLCLKSGDILILTLKNNDIIEKHTLIDVAEFEYCKNLQFDNKNARLLYNKFNKFDGNENFGNIYIYNLKSNKNLYLFSNSATGYWHNKQ